MPIPAKAVGKAEHQSEQIAALEREVAELRRQLALVSARSADQLIVAAPEELEPLQSEARYRALIELSPQVVWMTDTEGANTYCNRYWYEFSGLTMEQTAGWGWASIVHPDDVAKATKEWRKSVARGQDYELEVRFRRASDGEYRWYLCRGVPLKDASGKVLKWLGIAIDVHDRRTAAAAIAEANERMVMAVEAAGAGTWDYYPKTGRVECSPRCLEIFGAAVGNEATPESFLQAIHAQDRGHVLELIRRAMDPLVAADYDTDYRVVQPGGKVRWVFAKGKCFFAGEGAAREAVRLSGMVVDITERKEAERDRAALVAALQHSPDFIGTTDLKGRVLFLNHAGLEMVGLRDSAEGRTKTAYDFLYEKEQAILDKEILPLVRAGQIWEGEFRMRHFATGEPILVETRVFGIRDEAGKLTSMANLSRDISEKRKLEDQLRQAQKMEAVGRLAGGIAHDFNNLLTVIRGAAEVLQDSSQGSPKTEIVKEISDATERASALTEQLLAFGRRQMVQPRAINLNRVILGMQGVLKRLAGEDISLWVELESDLRPVKMDPSQVDQILMNLTTNARDAMPHGGVIGIRTFNSDVAPATVAPADANAGYAGFSFSDNGPGMDSETLSHIFEPFFTTKEPGKGTGLGLSTVYGIVQQGGGDITVESTPGQGTSFTLYLPRTTEEPAREDSAPPTSVVAGTGAVLLVEDEPSLRAIVAGYIRERGYRVHDAADAQEALKIAALHHIDLLLTDIVMPGTSGPALALSLAAIHPQVHVIFMSGYTDHAALEEALRQPNTLFLQKPFRLTALAAKMHEALAGRRAE
jgi:PAS domain S-box-containing protein